jgi:hypothetical protein
MRFAGRTAALAAAVCAGLVGISSDALAATPAGDGLTLQPSYGGGGAPLYLQDAATATPTPDAPPKPDKPLAGMFKKAGWDTGDVQIYGFIEGSYTYDFSNPPGDFIGGRVFDIDNQEVILNQIDLSLEKTVDAAAAAKDGKLSVGGKVEVIYGNDARFVHSNGLNFYAGGFAPHPENQFDLVQAYVDVGVPVGNGLMIRAGKMVTHMGYETINPTTNPFYSHSFLFGYAIPFTHTGIMAFYNLTDSVTLLGGICRGWDQALEDNNDSIDYMAQLKWVVNDKTTAYLNVITGPEQDGNNSDYRTVIDGILTYAVTDQLSLAVNGDYGWEPIGSDDAAWYGVAAYAGYKINDALTVNVRGEWFNDEDGARGIGDTVYEGTVGVAIHPFPNDDLGSNLVIRPELRVDYSENGIWDGGTDHYQWTAAVDAIFTF